jgi:hypothetical protein
MWDGASKQHFLVGRRSLANLSFAITLRGKLCLFATAYQ